MALIIKNDPGIVSNIGERGTLCSSINNRNGTVPERSERNDTAEISEEGIKACQKQTCDSDIDSGGMKKTSDSVLLTGAEETDEPEKSVEEASSEKTSENRDEQTQSSGMVGINAGKLARKLAAAKTKAQVQAVIAEIKQDLKECEAGRQQGMDVDEASLQAAKNVLGQANQRMADAANREATPEEEMAFSLAGLM